VEYWSWTLDHSGKIQSVGFLLLLLVLLWLELSGGGGLTVSANKAVSHRGVRWCCASDSLLAGCGSGGDRRGGARCGVTFFPVGRGGEEEKRRCTTSSLRRRLESCVGACSSAPSPLSWRHGGERRRELLQEHALGMAMEAQRRSSSTKAACADVIYGQQRPLRVVVWGWHHSIFYLQAVLPMRTFSDLKVALHGDGRPSGVVPGAADAGRSSRSRLRCGCEGLDCFSLFSDRLLCVKLQDCFCFSVFVRILPVKLPDK